MLTMSEKREKGRQQPMDKKGENKKNKIKTKNKMVKARNTTSVTVQVNISM
jgi:hypothetical protein